MAESQSRYSIVERLTMKKLDLMSPKSKLKEELKSKEQHVEESRKELTNWEKDIEQDIQRLRRGRERTIEQNIQTHENAKARLIEKEETFNAQITAVEQALKSIEEISKSQSP